MWSVAYALSAAILLWLLWYGLTALLRETGFGFALPWIALAIALLALNVGFLRSALRERRR